MRYFRKPNDLGDPGHTTEQSPVFSINLFINAWIKRKCFPAAALRQNSKCSYKILTVVSKPHWVWRGTTNEISQSEPFLFQLKTLRDSHVLPGGWSRGICFKFSWFVWMFSPLRLSDAWGRFCSVRYVIKPKGKSNGLTQSLVVPAKLKGLMLSETWKINWKGL